jgi:hypothetical protein
MPNSGECLKIVTLFHHIWDHDAVTYIWSQNIVFLHGIRRVRGSIFCLMSGLVDKYSWFSQSLHSSAGLIPKIYSANFLPCTFRFIIYSHFRIRRQVTYKVQKALSKLSSVQDHLSVLLLCCYIFTVTPKHFHLQYAKFVSLCGIKIEDRS